MAIAITLRGTPLHTTANTAPSTMTDAGTPTAGVLLLAVSVNCGNANAPSSAYTGYAQTWTAVGNFGWNTARNISIDACISASPNSTDPVATYASTTGAHMTVYEVTGVNTSAPILGGIFRDQGSGVYIVTNSANNTTPTATLAAALHPSNRPFMVIEHAVEEDTVPEGTWTELNDGAIGGTPASQAMTSWRSDAFDTSIATSAVTSSFWGIVGFELIAAKSGLATLGVG